MFKTETHLHTLEISNCAHIRAIDMVKKYYSAGYKTLIISDHLTKRYTDSLGDIPWNDKMTVFYSGYYKAKEEAKKYGMNVLPGAEVCFNGVDGDYLAFGLTKEIAEILPDLCEMSIEEFYEKTRKYGILLVQAHPYRDGVSKPTDSVVDGVEIYNSNPRHDDHNDMAEKFAKENGLLVTSGSDAHRDEDVACSGIETEVEIKTNNEFIEIIKSGKYKIIR